MSSNRESRDLAVVVRAPALRLVKLAEYHARSAGEVRSEEDIYSELLTAFWLGELGDVYTSSKLHRSDILRVVGVVREHPGFTLVEREEDLIQKIVEYPDGSVSFDPKPILLPRDPALWTDKIRNAAYSELATRPIYDFAEAVKVVLYALSVQKEDYGEFCDRAGLPRPLFWFGAGQRSEPKKWSKRELSAWMRKIFSGPRMPKADVVAAALKQFPDASRAAVVRAWRESAPPEWQRGGALSKTGNRGFSPK
jgi:hypothetical protein